ncbi:MAG: PAN/Apple domain-containing protein [Rhodobacteraceae bacterium]|nr:PAN/Apple domain-containing protein [Paracoccaceae bacterium]
MQAVDAIKQAPFGHNSRGMRTVKIADKPVSLAFKAGSFGHCGLGNGTVFDHLIKQIARMHRQLFVGGEKLAAFLLQQAFSGKSATPFACKAFANIAVHPGPEEILQSLPWIRLVKTVLMKTVRVRFCRLADRAKAMRRSGIEFSMGVLMRGLFGSCVVAVAIAIGVPVQAEGLIPERRFAMSQDIDLPGGDIAQMFDTTLEACQTACAVNQSCEAFTFNTRNGSCFSKAGPGAGEFFQGAVSGLVIRADAGAEGLAGQRNGHAALHERFFGRGISRVSVGSRKQWRYGRGGEPDGGCRSADGQRR